MQALKYDDGILKTYKLVNTADAGKKPVEKLQLQEDFYYGESTVYYKRFFTAMQVGRSADMLVHIPGRTTKPFSIVILDDGKQYTVLQEQPSKHEGLDVTFLTLERVSENYEFASST